MNDRRLVYFHIRGRLNFGVVTLSDIYNSISDKFIPVTIYDDDNERLTFRDYVDFAPACTTDEVATIDTPLIDGDRVYRLRTTPIGPVRYNGTVRSYLSEHSELYWYVEYDEPDEHEDEFIMKDIELYRALVDSGHEFKEGDKVYKYKLDGMYCDLVLGTVYCTNLGDDESCMIVRWDDDTLDFITEDLEIYKLNK